ncbi:MAG: Energy-coupling factor transporter ATP-binding protein EcfA1 [Firmicutes bacterium ADurb.Bin182]|nr:MAG: Energy-coupling factor transporter ATP-binding protein EcfA1 [Firmicutes bacterium ADurb.Bin182]
MIELKNVTYSYNENETALRGVSLSVKKGEFLAIVGHNGSGKSTLAKLLNALLIPKTGDVLVDGMNTRDESVTLAIRQKVGMVFQNPDNQLVTTIVEEDVGFGPENLGIPPEEIRKRVDRALETVGMSKYARFAPHTLSGGQKQRIAIAGMLAMQPEVLVLDEATAMLDPSGRREVLDNVAKLNREQGMTVVMITQYMEETVIADRVAVMAKGLIEMTGKPADILKNSARLRELGLDAPAMVLLRDALMLEGVRLPCDAITVEEIAKALCPLLSAV